MSSTKCPRCGNSATGNFCSVCGTSLGSLFCNQCGAETEPGARFCNRCGNPLAQGAAGSPAPASGPAGRAAASPTAHGAVSSPAAPGGRRMLWWVAGGAFVGLLLIVAYPVIQGEQGTQGPAVGTPAASGGMPGSGPSSLDLTSMTPREAADRLYDRIMRAVEAGDSAEAAGFLPMAISAYEIAEPLNADGRFHVATLKQTQGDFEGAMASALAGLEDNPDHLLNLAAAARASHALGDDAAARERYTRLLEVWEPEMGKGLEEYDLHSRMLPDLRAEAEAFLDP